MSISRKPYKTFTKEFKLEAVRLMSESNKPAAEIAAELGIRRNMLYKWKEQLGSKGDEAFLKQAGRPLKEEHSEVLTLKQENRRLREEVEILKKAAVYFAKELK
jgi:transposase